MLEIKELGYKHKHSKNGIEDISMSAKSGEITVVLGPNGAGKTTFFRSTLGALKADVGNVFVGNEDITDKTPKEKSKYMAYVPQEWQSPFRFKVLEVVMMGFASRLGMFSQPSKTDEQEALSKLEGLGILHLKDRGIDEISGGERQMVLLARALVQNAPVLLLDEPTSHLDLKNQMKVLCHLESLVKKNKITALVTIHDPNLAAQFADYVVAIKNGKLFAKGMVEEVMKKEVLAKLYDTDIEVSTLCDRPIVRGLKECGI